MALFDSLVRRYRAWVDRQLDQALQEPVLPSQGEQWRAMQPLI